MQLQQQADGLSYPKRSRNKHVKTHHSTGYFCWKRSPINSDDAPYENIPMDRRDDNEDKYTGVLDLYTIFTFMTRSGYDPAVMVGKIVSVMHVPAKDVTSKWQALFAQRAG